MASIIRIKRSETAGNPSTLGAGELAYSALTDNGSNGGDRLYIGIGTEISGDAANHYVIGGKFFTDRLDHTAGTLTANSAIVVDGDSKIDVLNVDNITINGNTISSTNTDGNITLTPNGNGLIDISGAYTLPTSDGTSGQALITNGSGTVSFTAISTSMDIAGDTGTDTVSLINDTLTFTGGTGIDTAVTDNTVTITLNQEQVEDYVNGLFVAGEGIDLTYDDGAGTFTVDGEDASTSNKGIASFSSDNFAVSSGEVTIKDGGVANAELVNSTITVAGDSGSQAIDLGDTLTVTGGAGVTSSVSGDAVTLAVNVDDSSIEISGDSLQVKSLGITNAMLAGSIANAKLQNPSITIGSAEVSLGGTFAALTGLQSVAVDNITIDGNTVSSTDTDGDINLSPDGTGTVIVPSGYEGRAGFQSQSLVNKAYVDSVANGLDVKASVRVATTADLSATYDNGAGTLTADSNGAIEIDGVTLSVDDRVLVKDQSTAAENGFYKVTATGGASAAFVLTRTPDADAASELTGGAFTFVEAGTANADNGYVMTQNGAITLGTTDITFEQFSGAGQIDAGAALTKTGNTLNVSVDDSSIEVSGDSLQVKASGITNAMLAGSIANAKLVNDSITINSYDTALGSSVTLVTDDIAEDGSPTNLWYTDARSRAAVSVQASTGLAYNSSTGVFSGVNATTSVKGVASFSSDNFTVSSGAVSIAVVDGGTYS